MKIQLTQLDLSRPWPEMRLEEGYHAMQVFVRIGTIPVGEIMTRPARRRIVTHRRLRRRIAKKLSPQILRLLTREALTAGPQTLIESSERYPTAERDLRALLTSVKPLRVQRFVHDAILQPAGLSEPFAAWVRQAQRASIACPPVTVAICTRDRGDMLENCINWLSRLDYPRYEILVVDNSSDIGAQRTRQIAEKHGVSYVREPQPGLSRARNRALEVAEFPWIAFTDDDCQPEPNWLKELVRPLQDGNCRCVTGLVMPAQLDNIAEITFEVYGGLGRGCVGRVYDRAFLTRYRTRPGPTWLIGAGANMLIHVDFARYIGGWDVDMGPGPRSVGGCGEDTDVFYQILQHGHSIRYTPRAIVHHYHRATPEALRKHIYSYAVGHAAYHWRCFWRYRDHRSLVQLAYHLPRWFARNIRRGIRGKTKYPFSLVFLEIKGTVVGPMQYSGVKLRRFGRFLRDTLLLRNRQEKFTVPFDIDPATDPEALEAMTYNALVQKKSA